MIGPDHSPLDNFPCVERCSEDHLFTDVGDPENEDDEDGACVTVFGDQVVCDRTAEETIDEEDKEPVDDSFLTAKDLNLNTPRVDWTVEDVPDSISEGLDDNEVADLFTEQPNLPLEVRKMDPPVCCTLEENNNGTPYLPEIVAEEAPVIQAGLTEARDFVAQAQPIISEAIENGDLDIEPNTELPSVADIENVPVLLE